MSLELSESFLFTTPHFIEKYGVLMKRQTETSYIDINSISAGITINIYTFLLALFLGLFLVSFLNERFHHSQQQNSVWRLLLSLFPDNGAMWKYQFGATRKVLMATSGFAVLIFSSLYQAKLAEQLLIPYPPPVVTFKDIEEMISSGRAKLIFNDVESAVSSYITNVSTIIAASLEYNQPHFTKFNYDAIFDLLDTKNGIYIHAETTVMNLLANIEQNLCKNYIFVTFDEMTRMYISLIIRKERVDLLESMNVVVAERFRYFDDNIQSS